MAQLVQSFVGDTALRLQGEEFVRKMAWGYDWRRLQISVNHAIPQATGTFSDAFYYIGLCEGTTNTLKAGSTTEWVGCWVGTAGSNWNYTAGPPGGITQGGNNYKWGYKQGASLTTVSNISVNNYIGTTYRDYWTLCIEQSAAGYNVAMRTPSAIPTIDRINREFELLSLVEQDPIRAINFSTNRRLDTVSIYWAFPSVGIELSEILVVRLT